MERQQTLTIRRPAHGFVLLIALIGLAAMTIAAAMLARSIISGNQVAGNIALRQSVEQTMGLGLEMAMTQLLLARDRLDHVDEINVQETNHLNLRWTRSGLDTACDGGNTCWYYPIELLAQDPHLPAALNACSIRDAGYQSNIPPGIPACIPRGNVAINWFDNTGFKPFTSDDNTNLPPGYSNRDIPPGYSIRYIIDRQCAWRSSDDSKWLPSQGNPSGFSEENVPKAEHVAAVRKFCRISEVTSTTGPGVEVQKMGEDSFDPSLNMIIPQVYYRISIQVIGPRATTHFAQVIALI